VENKTINMVSKKQQKKRSRKGRVKDLPAIAAPPASQRALLCFSKVYSQAELAAGTGASYFFRLNSVYDPDSTGVGNVAIGYNTWSALYLNYKVLRATVRVIGQATTTPGTPSLITVAPVPRQAVIPSSADAWRVIPGSFTKLIMNATDGGTNSFDFTGTWDLAKVAHVTRSQYANDMDFSGSVGANPTREIFFFVGNQGVTSALASTFRYDMRITYEVEWFNPVPLQ
jgi:hypothetical protein